MRTLKDKKPITTFIDEEDSVSVELISWPNLKQTERMFVNTCYGHEDPEVYDKLSKKEKTHAIKTLLEGGSLPKGLEMCGKFVFLIKNIPLTVTHCLVRHRFFTILQSSTAVKDLRNESFLMPKSFSRDKQFYTRVKDWYLMGKDLFCEAIDKHEMSVQNARHLIPKNNSNHMFIGCDLLTLKMAYSQRMDTQEEPIQHNIIFKRMKELVIEKFPYLESFFVRGCDVGMCLHSKPGLHSNVVFKRDKLHRKFLPKGYDCDKKDNLLHDFTRDEANNGPKIEKETYIGLKKTNRK